MSIDVAELEQLRAATRVSGLFTWTVELGAEPLTRARTSFTGTRDVLGYPSMPDELGASLELLVIDSDRAQVIAGIQAFLEAEDERYEAQYRIRLADGSVRWTLARGVIRRDSSDRPIRFLGSNVDVTRPLQEAELHALATKLSGVNIWNYEIVDGDIIHARSLAGSNVLQVLGYPQDTSPGDFTEGLRLVIAPEDQARVFAKMRACVLGETATFEDEYRVIHKDGSVQWRLGRGVTIRDDRGRPVRFTGTSVDVTGLKNAEAAARAANERLDEAMKLGGFTVAEIDVANPLDLAEWGEQLQSSVVAQDLESTRAYFAAVADGSALPERQFEFRARMRDGTIGWRAGRAKLIGGDVNATRVLGVSYDIHQAKTAEEEARRAIAQLKLTSELSGSSIWRYRLAGNDLGAAIPMDVTPVSATGQDMLGAPENFAARLALVVVPEDLDGVERAIRDAIDGTTPRFEAEYRSPHVDGSVRWVLARAIIMRDAAGRPIEIAGTSVDVTRIKHAEEEAHAARLRLARTIEELETAERERRATDDQLQLVVRLANIGLWTFDLTGGDLGIGGATRVRMQAAEHYSTEQLRDFKTTVERTVIPEDQGVVMTAVANYLAGKSAELEFEYRARNADGTLLWRLARGVVLRGADGRALRLSGVAVDVTRIKDAEENARAARELLEIGTSIAGLSVVEIDRRGVAPEDALLKGAGNWAQRGFDTFGPVTLVDFMKRTVVEEDLPAALDQFFATNNGEEREPLEFRSRNPIDGSIAWRLGMSRLICDDRGSPVRYIAVTIDIESIKKAEEQIKTAEERARKAMEQQRLATDLSGVGVWGYELGDDSDLATARSAFEIDGVLAGLGYEPGEFEASLTARLGAIVHPDDQAAMYSAVQDVFAGKTPMIDAEYRFIAKDGSTHWRMVHGLLTRDDRGRPRTFMGTAVDVDQLKQAQEELRRIKDRLELAITGSQACTWDLELPEGTYNGVTPSFTNAWELCGYEPPADPALAGQAFVTVMRPDELRTFLHEMREFLDSRKREWEIEFRIVHKDGSDHWLLSRGVAMRDRDGRATRLTGASIDITDRKNAEKALQESEDRFRGTFENAAVGMAIAKLDGWFVEVNQRFADFLGYRREELATKRFQDLMLPAEISIDVDSMQRLAHGEIDSFTRDKRYIRADGAVVWANLTTSVIQRDVQGKPLRVMAILQDINERKKLEVELEQAHERMQLAMRGSDVAVFDGIIPNGDLLVSEWTHFNMWETIGFDPASGPRDVDGVLARTVHPDDVPRARAYVEGAIATRSPEYYLEHRIVHADGSTRWRLTRGTFLYDAAGFVRRLIGTTTDITQLKAIEGELQRAREASESANRAKDEFLANVSHEIRTPMNAILGMTELALDSSPTAHQRELLATVRSAAKNMLTIINDLLDFSKIASGKMTLDQTDFSLRRAVGDTLRALAVRAHSKGLELLCHVGADVPDAIEGDAGRLRQILMNLVGNAIKFTPQGEVEVVVAAEPPTGPSVALVFTVRDTGIGIARDKQAAIFHAFEQEDSSTTRKYGGTGLGLTISAQLVALMGGEITVQSAPGCGSTFRFTAQFARSSRPESSIVPPERLATLGRPERGRPLRILVAEDNELNVTLLRALLDQRGHFAVFAPDGRAALDLALREAFDLMLLDLHMPEFDGFDVVKAVREHERGTGQHLRIIALTARSSVRDRERCLAAGMDEFLAKPIEAAALWSTIDLLIERWPVAPPDRAPGILDTRAILRACGRQAAILDKLRAVLHRTLPGQIARIRAALVDDNFAELREAAHQLVATVGAFSTVTAQMASSIEDAAIREDRTSCATLVLNLESLCDALLAATETLTFGSLAV